MAKAAGSSTSKRARLQRLNDRAGWFVLGGVWLAIGVLFMAIGLQEMSSRALLESQLLNEGRIVEGKVLRKWISEGSGRNAGTSYWCLYRFTMLDGKTIENRAAIRASAWDRLSEQGSIRITYVPGAPESHLVEGQTSPHSDMGLVFSIVGAVLSLLGGLVLRKALQTPHRGRRV